MTEKEIISQFESFRDEIINDRQYASAENESIPIRDILAERQRQNEKWGLQNHELPVWMAILGEEFGELCEAVNETYFDNGIVARRKGGYKNLYTEATHVAAVAMQIMEFLNRTYKNQSENNGGNNHVR